MRKQDNNYNQDRASIKSRIFVMQQNLLRIWRKYLQDKPISIAVLSSLMLWLVYSIISLFIGSSSSAPNKIKEQQQFTKEQEQKDKDNTLMSGIKEAVDPRDVWTNRIENKIEQSASEAEENYHKSLQEKDEKIAVLEQKLNNEIKALRELVVRTERNIAAISNHQDNSNSNTNNTNHTNYQGIQRLKVKSSSRLGYVKRVSGESKKDLKDYAPSGSHVRAVLLTGLAVGTGTNSSSSPEPIVLRLTDSSLFAKGYKTEQLAEATLIGDCSGDISSERAKCRLQTLSLKNRKGEIIEKPIEGWVIGEDGRAGIKGIVVDKSSNVARTAVLSGVLSGISQFFQNQATKGVFPISAITGQTNPLKPADAIKGGVFAGAGNAMEKLADYAIARAESMSPVLMIASGREVDVVFRKGIDLNEDGISTTINNPGNSGGSSGLPQDQSVSKLGERGEQETIGGSSNFSRGTKLSAKYLDDADTTDNQSEASNSAALMRVLQESPASQISSDNQANNEVNNDWINTPATERVDNQEAMIPAEYDTPIDTMLNNNQASESNTANQNTIEHQKEGF